VGRAAWWTLGIALAACGGGAPAVEGPAADAALRAGRGRVAGTIRGADGAPVGLARVEVYDARGDAVIDDLADAAGGFRVDLAPGAYRVVAHQGDARGAVEGLVVVAGRTASLAVELAADPGDAPGGDPAAVDPARRTGAIVGRVVDGSTGGAFPGAVVMVTGDALADAIPAISDDDGRYRVTGLPPGIYVLSVYYHLVERCNLELRRGDDAVTAGGATAVDLALDLRLER
jgi:hypothetical protein